MLSWAAGKTLPPPNLRPSCSVHMQTEINFRIGKYQLLGPTKILLFVTMPLFYDALGVVVAPLRRRVSKPSPTDMICLAPSTQKTPLLIGYHAALVFKGRRTCKILLSFSFDIIRVAVLLVPSSTIHITIIPLQFCKFNHSTVYLSCLPHSVQCWTISDGLVANH